MPEQATEIVALLQSVVAGVDSQLEFWLTTTFAVIVASFLARNELSKKLRLALATLYLLSVALVVLRLAHHVENATFLLSLLDDLGVKPPATYAWIAMPVRVFLLAFGTIAATAFTLRPDLAKQDEPATHEPEG